MLTTPLRNLKPSRVLVRLQNSARVRPATAREIKQLAGDVQRLKNILDSNGIRYEDDVF